MRLRALSVGVLVTTAATFALTGTANAAPSTPYRTQGVAPQMSDRSPYPGHCTKHADGKWWCRCVRIQERYAPHQAPHRR